MNKQKVIFLLFILLSMYFFISCSPKEEKTDTYYFSALQKIENGEKEEAVTLLEKGIRNSSPAVSRLCSLYLSEINKKKAIEIIENALKQFPDDNAVNCRYMTVLYEAGKYNELLDFSEKKREFLGKDNEYIKYRLLALAKIGDNRFANEFESWFTETKFTSYHREFLDDWHKDSSYIEFKYYNEDTFDRFEKVINARLYVNAGNYSKAYKEICSAEETEEKLVNLLCSFSLNVLSDIGKAFLYGTSNKVVDALIFSKAGVQAEQNEKKQILFFYAGRMLDKAGSAYRNTALENLRTSYSLAADSASRDNALWYYLETSRHISLEKAVSALNELAPSWTDPTYFEDFLDDLSQELLYAKENDLFCNIFEKNKFYFSKASYTKYAYITARLIEENMAEAPSGPKQIYIDSLLDSAWETSEANTYYRILLADKMKKSDFDFFASDAISLEIKDSDEEKIAASLLDNSLYQHFYTYYKNNWRNISELYSIELIKQIKEAEKANKEKYADVLRLASTGLSDSELKYRKDIFKSLYPRFYEDEISEKTAEYKLPEYFVYSLIRTESYFDFDVYSSAGAIGLCQLMEQTASDIAKKLKMEQYDLLDPDTNMTFGIYYLSELIRRLDNNSIQAFLAYNCGITRVRNWNETFKELPVDLFLEIVPIEETREYGKKILTAACLYGNLYYEKPFSLILDEMFCRLKQS